MDALRDQHNRALKEEIKEEVVDCGFVEVDPEDVHQLCTACLCATRTTHTLDDVTLKQHYMNILTETQLETGEPVLQSPRLCWECVAHLKRSVRFREQVQDSYRLLQPMLLMVDKEDRAEFLHTSVRRSGRLRTCFSHSIDISAQDDDTVMTADEDNDYEAPALKYLEKNIEALPPPFLETVATIDDETSESVCDQNIDTCVSEDLDEQLKAIVHTSKNVKKRVTSIDTPESNELKSSFICDNCSKLFASKTALERHIATYNIYPHNIKAVPFPCQDCVVVLCSDDQCSECTHGHRLLQHISIKTNIAKNHCQRNACHNPKTISNTNSLILHSKPYANGKPSKHLNHLTQTGEKPFQCEVCHISYADKKQLTIHIRIHTGEKPFQCDMCQRYFSLRHNLFRHLRLHTGEKPFQCEVCHKSFVCQSYLIKHRITHSVEKPFQCDVCEKYFSHKQTLVKHMRKHTDEKPFQCEVCHISFVLESQLIYHMRAHAGEKPFQCEICQKYFSHKFVLMRHRGTHTGEKPFQCVVCCRYFAQKGNLLQHFRTHTGEKSFIAKRQLINHDHCYG